MHSSKHPRTTLRTVQNDAGVQQKLQGFDAYMEKVVKDWNAPGIGVGIVMGDKLGCKN